MKKFTNFAEAINTLEELDQLIYEKFELEDYDFLLENLAKRGLIISQITLMQKDQTIPPDALRRLQHLWEKIKQTVDDIQTRKGQISERLKAHHKTITKNKSFAY